MLNELLLMLQILAGMLVLVPASGLLIHAFIELARHFRMRRFLLIFLVAGIAAALPELLISLNAAFTDQVELALANAVGTSVALVALVAGIIAIMHKSFKTTSLFTGHGLAYLTFACLLFIVLAADGELSRTDGVLLIGAFCFYVWNLYQAREHYKLPEFSTIKSGKQIVLYFFVILLTLSGAFFAASYVVAVSNDLISISSIPIFLLGITVVAPLGALPELISEMELNSRKENTLTLGELFTSVVVNTTLVIGIAALIHPFRLVSYNLFSFNALCVVIILILFNLFVRSKKQLNQTEGMILVAAYLLYLVANFLIASY